MRRDGKVFLLLLTILCVLAASTVASLYTQNQNSLTSSKQTLARVNPEQWPVVDYSAPEPIDPRERARRQAKGKKYNRDLTRIAPDFTEIDVGFHWPIDFPPLPIVQSNAIVIGEVKNTQAFLSSDRTGVYSEFTVHISEVLKNGGSALLAIGSSIVLERIGGRVRFPSGKIGWVRVIGQGMPQIGQRYVFFLTCSDQGDFNLLTGYELRSGQVFPLDSGTPHFEVYEGADETIFLDKLRTAITNSSRAPQGE